MRDVEQLMTKVRGKIVYHAFDRAPMPEPTAPAAAAGRPVPHAAPAPSVRAALKPAPSLAQPAAPSLVPPAALAVDAPAPPAAPDAANDRIRAADLASDLLVGLSQSDRRSDRPAQDDRPLARFLMARADVRPQPAADREPPTKRLPLSPAAKPASPVPLDLRRYGPTATAAGSTILLSEVWAHMAAPRSRP